MHKEIQNSNYKIQFKLKIKKRTKDTELFSFFKVLLFVINLSFVIYHLNFLLQSARNFLPKFIKEQNRSYMTNKTYLSYNWLYLKILSWWLERGGTTSSHSEQSSKTP